MSFRREGREVVHRDDAVEAVDVRAALGPPRNLIGGPRHGHAVGVEREVAEEEALRGHAIEHRERSQGREGARGGEGSPLRALSPGWSDRDDEQGEGDGPARGVDLLVVGRPERHP